MDEPLTLDDFVPLVGRAARLGGASASLVLDRVEAGPAAPTAFRQPFIVVFRASRSEPVAAEGLYVCEIDCGPRLELYVAPIHTPERAFQDYQAVFN